MMKMLNYKIDTNVFLIDMVRLEENHYRTSFETQTVPSSDYSTYYQLFETFHICANL